MEKYIGIMSGTSLDGVDTALIGCDGHQVKLLASDFYPIAPQLKQAVLNICTGQATTVMQIGVLDHQLGRLFANAVNQLLARSNTLASEVTAIGSHGQTVFHAPDIETPFTMQLGDANLIAAKTGIPTVADFRRKDMAYGGQGAPLVPAFHQALFGHLPQNSVILNIGGIANISIIRTDTSSGFDTGPGNMLMDAWIHKHQQLPYDKNGAWAASGQVDQALLSHLLTDRYFAQAAPKSTGREHFNLHWLEENLRSFATSPQDVQATLLALTVETISLEVKKLSDNTRDNQLLVCGGGAQNLYLMKMLAHRLPEWQLANTLQYGIDSDFMEAMAFAWLARQTMHRQPGNLPAATGAQQSAILGGIYWPE